MYRFKRYVLYHNWLGINDNKSFFMSSDNYLGMYSLQLLSKESFLKLCFCCYRGVFPWKSSSSKNQDAPTTVSWRLFGSKSSGNLASKSLNCEVQKSLTPVSSAANTPHHHHKRQGSSASEKQFEDLVASSMALIQHDR